MDSVFSQLESMHAQYDVDARMDYLDVMYDLYSDQQDVIIDLIKEDLALED